VFILQADPGCGRQTDLLSQRLWPNLHLSRMRPGLHYWERSCARPFRSSSGPRGAVFILSQEFGSS
jgi:hypothetical protein